MKDVIAIFDIGKTNKKFFLFDEDYRIVSECSVRFEEIADEDGYPCDDILRITGWVKETLTSALRNDSFNIKAVNFSTYGASFVYVDEAGHPVTPLYNYLKPYPAELSQAFYAKYGGEERVARETASPILGSLNSGMQLYRIKQQNPALFHRIGFALHFPQYLRFIVGGEVASDLTSIGCHTQLWDFSHWQYHGWVKKEGLEKVLAPIIPADHASVCRYAGKEMLIGSGLHDSSAALIPYLKNFEEPFVLLSTGTWCITLNPFNETELTVDELRKDCLCFIGYHGKPVKAARLFAGDEHERQIKRLSAYFLKPVNYFSTLSFDPELSDKLMNRLDLGHPCEGDPIVPFSFSSRDLSSFVDYEEAYYCLVLDILQRLVPSIRLVLPENSDIKKLFVDGGFGNNKIFMNLLSRELAGISVYAAEVAQASAIGSAMALHSQWNSHSLSRNIALKSF